MPARRIYHIALQGAWDAAPSKGGYSAASLETEGFIHASTLPQLQEVAERLFAGTPDLIVLCIDPDRVVPEIKFENCEGGEERYPHIYGVLGLEAVCGTAPLRFEADGTVPFDCLIDIATAGGEIEPEA